MIKYNSIYAIILTLIIVDGTSFHWERCPDSLDPQLDCGSLRVPMNHINFSSGETIDLALRRYRTNSTNRLGSILLNPGGPGTSGLWMANSKAIALVGGHYDIIGFDPRGVGQSRPIRCTRSSNLGAIEMEIFASQQIPFEGEYSNTTIDQFGAHLLARVKRCEKYDGEYLKYLSTAFVARDMEAIRATLGEPVLNYYCFSNGGTLGATYMNMFPERVGRIILDSALDPSVYTGSTGNRWAETVHDADNVFSSFIGACVKAGPFKCPLAEVALTQKELVREVQRFLDNVGYTPMVVPSGDSYVVRTGKEIRTFMSNTLDDPSKWLILANYLHDNMRGNALSEPQVDSCTSAGPYRGANMEFLVYLANDGDSKTPVDWTAKFQQSRKTSSLLGPMWMADAMVSKYWTTEPIERFAGPWNKSITNPILLFHNILDPATPLRGAKNLASLMGNNAILVVQNGVGHGTPYTPSDCLHAIRVNYFNYGALPTQGTVCEVNMTPFD